MKRKPSHSFLGLVPFLWGSIDIPTVEVPNDTNQEINVTQSTSISSGGSYDFGNVTQATSSSAIKFTIENTGTTDLTLSSLPILSGTNASEFNLDTTATSSSIAGSSSTTFNLTFSPVSTGSKVAVITIFSDDADEGTYTIGLTGTASAAPIPEIDIKQTTSIASGASYDFGSITSGNSSSTITFTIENTGAATLTLSSVPSISGTNASEFSLDTTATSSSIAAGSSTTYNLTFSPTSTGSKTATVTVASDDADEGTYTIGLTGTASAAPMPEIDIKQTTSIASGASYDFGSITSGSSSSTVTFTIENTGAATLTLSSVPSISGTNASEFSLDTTATSSSIAAGSSTTYTLTFNPTSTGAKTAVVTVASDDADEGTYTINLVGTGTTAVPSEINLKQSSTSIVNGGSYDFATVAQSVSSAAVSFTIENTGLGNLVLSGSPKIVVGGSHSGDFVVNETSTLASIPGTSTTTFTVTFTPSTTGARSATLTIANNDTDESSYVINLSGTGTLVSAPTIEVMHSSKNTNNYYHFRTVSISASSTITPFSIENTGTATLNLTDSPIMVLGGSHPGDFSVDYTSTSNTIAPSASTIFTVTFTPSATGSRSANLRIANTDTSEDPYIIYLVGTGTSTAKPDLEIRQDSINIGAGYTYPFGSVNQTSSSGEITFTVENPGASTLNLHGAPNKVYASGGNTGDFTVNTSATASSIAIAGSTTFTISFTPTTTGSRSATITIPTNDSDYPFFWFFVEGTGTP